MSRAYIETTIGSDSTLAGLGIDDTSVFNQHDIDERPKNNSRFIVLRWEELVLSGIATSLERGARNLSIWVHSPKEVSTDFDAIDKILDRIDELLGAIENAAGSDGYTITTVSKAGRSADLYDEGFNTVGRSALYRVLYRRT